MLSIKRLTLFETISHKLHRFATSLIMDGADMARQVKREIKESVILLRRNYNVTPGLAIILVGSRRDSVSYVNAKEKACAEVGFKSFHFQYDENVTQSAILSRIDELNSGK